MRFGLQWACFVESHQLFHNTLMRTIARHFECRAIAANVDTRSGLQEVVWPRRPGGFAQSGQQQHRHGSHHDDSHHQLPRKAWRCEEIHTGAIDGRACRCGHRRGWRREASVVCRAPSRVGQNTPGLRHCCELGMVGGTLARVGMKITHPVSIRRLDVVARRTGLHPENVVMGTRHVGARSLSNRVRGG